MPVAAAYASARKPWRSSASKRSYASMQTGRTPRPRRRWGRLPTRCETPSKAVDDAKAHKLRGDAAEFYVLGGTPFLITPYRYQKSCVSRALRACPVEVSFPRTD